MIQRQKESTRVATNDNISGYKALATKTVKHKIKPAQGNQWWGERERERAYSAFSMDKKQQE